MKALIWKKAFRARGTKFMALRLLALHVHHAPTGRGRERAYKQELSLRCQGPLDGHQHSSGLPLPPQDQHPQTPVLGTQGGEGEGAPLPRVTGGDSPQALAGPHLGGLVHPSCSPPPPQSKIPQECNNSGVAGGREPRAALRQRAGSSARVLRQEKAPRDPPHYKQASSPVQLMGTDIPRCSDLA